MIRGLSLKKRIFMLHIFHRPVLFFIISEGAPHGKRRFRIPAVPVHQKQDREILRGSDPGKSACPVPACFPDRNGYANKDTFLPTEDIAIFPFFCQNGGRQKKEALILDICLAIDIGASSGRHIAGWMEDGALRTREVYRFPNGVREQDGHLVWDTDALLSHVKAGIDEALKAFPRIRSLSVDTWGVDYVLMRGDREVTPCYAYRDSRTQAVIPQVHGKISFSGLYRRTGIQYQPFNTVYQLYADKAAGRLEGVTDFLMIPEYLMYKLCGVKSHEYTNATTGGMVSAETGEYDPEIIRALELPEAFPAAAAARDRYRGIQGDQGNALRHP